MNQVEAFWHPAPSRWQDIYVAFRTTITLEHPEPITIRLFGCDMYRIYCQGREIGEGPPRFALGQPEYDTYLLELAEGRHELIVTVHYYGVPTRITANKLPPFLQADVRDSGGKPIILTWLCRELDAYLPMGRRVNGQLGWAERCDTRLLPEWNVDERMEAPDESLMWRPVKPVDPWIDLAPPMFRPATAERRCHSLSVKAAQIGAGRYVNRFGYEMDDPPVRFMLRELQSTLSPDGVWFRFDLGKVGLYRPSIILDVPKGTVIEAGYSEFLTDERVMPVISLSASQSCHMDRWIARGGKQTFSTFSARGFRFLELHVEAPPEQVAVHEAAALQRSYFGSPVGRFESSDPLLNQIWSMCVETLQSCSEDALTDTPTRERGQWLGDAVAVGMEVLEAAYGDLSLIRRSLEQAVLCRRDDGMIPGCYPGQIIPVSSFAMLWVSGCMRYYGLTGDRHFIQSHFAAANEVVDLYWSCLTENGIARFPYWDFVDWGHMVTKDEVNVALNVLVWKAISDLTNWAEMLGDKQQFRRRSEQRDRLTQIILDKMTGANGLLLASIPVQAADCSGQSNTFVENPGFHANVFALRYGLLSGDLRARAVDLIKRHMLNCFPNRSDAPRLSNPAANDRQLITPYFGHYALTALLEQDEAAFVIQQFRTCWGWMLEQGATTLFEVFDHRWSHCHAWSGCPSWQLSNYFLGLQPRGAGETLAFDFRLHTGGLTYASGTRPIVNTDGTVRIAWRQTEKGIYYECVSDRELVVFLPADLPYSVTLIDGETQVAAGGYFRTMGFKAILSDWVS
ncbi:hypothetical protein M6D81_10440 [Paenibacillus sp. J5C_2022]|uniref:alpha-L-rhamnosidase-related protein n=1 Tax=Paenibacillus sp. J5C2022 TaxID=2977129 RepID=UPI0021D183F1|nr:hypothetical protein [Paenibacillus sp. J5C2022]MCU6709129.1 hypothetical protein [Paenibacillus sp. J5C2022]